jgi:cell wall-associated NlpC family hydrolase
MADRRVTPARADLAAAHLKGKVQAERYVEGRMWDVHVGRASLRTEPSGRAAQDSELLYGERVAVYDVSDDGWAWIQAESDRYVGYVRNEALGEVEAATLRVCALMAPVFSAADLKSAITDFLPMNAMLMVRSRQGDYVEFEHNRFVHQRHLGPAEKDFVSVAERFLGAPYVWGGKTAAGLDCSGLIQTALQATGKAAPRDTDMMEKALGEPVPLSDIRRGDLVFWKGHMGVMLDETRLLHANAFHMLVAIEPLAEAIARIEKVAGPVTSIKRL